MREKQRVLSFASVDITRDGRRVLSREREEDGEWINLKSAIGFLGPNSLSPPSSFHRFIFIGERLLFSGFNVTLSRLFSQNARRRACSVHNACVCVLIY